MVFYHKTHIKVRINRTLWEILTLDSNNKYMEYLIAITSSISTVTLLGVATFLLRNYIVEKLKFSLSKEHSKFIDKLQWERKVQEQAARVAEYLALARRLKETSSEKDYERANQLSWELAMWLPEEIYKKMVQAIAAPNKDDNELEVAISVRKLLLGDKAENLSSKDIAHHAPGIGKKATP
jgi:hypothetical protein